MSKNNKTKEKICSFYASDYHFEMISLPYIYKTLEDNGKIIIMTENNLEESINFLLSKINLKKEKKEMILNLNWKNEDEIKIKKLVENDLEGKNVSIFVKGNENYIKKINSKLNSAINVMDKSKVKIIDFYNMEEIGDRINGIVNDYDVVLNTKGEKQV